MQRKLHHWAVDETDRCFDDLYNLVYDPRSSPSRGSGCGRTRVRVLLEPMGSHRGLSPGGGGRIACAAPSGTQGAVFRPDPVREVTIPKANGKLRSLGIATVADRVVQASLKLVLEPIFEADFHPCSYGFRPRRRAQDAIAEIHHLASGSRAYHWVFEGDITACFDEISHSALMDRVRRRIGDKRVLALVKSFLKAGILSKDLGYRDNVTGTPQGGILSPLLSNVALSVLDEHFAAKWKALGSEWTRAKHRRAGVPTMKIVRYADDFCVMVHGTRVDAEALWGEIAAVLAPMGLRLSVEKSRVCHIDEGFEFLGFRIQRQLKKGTTKHYVYTWPSKKALMSITEKVRNLTRRHKHRALADLLRRLNPVLRGWCNYFQHGVSKRTFDYLDHFAWWRVVTWMRKRHHGLAWGVFHRRFLPNWQIREGKTAMFRPQKVEVTRYRYRGTKINTPWTARRRTSLHQWHESVESPLRRDSLGGSEGGRETDWQKCRHRASVHPYTYLSTGEGWLYLCAVRDGCSRRVIAGPSTITCTPIWSRPPWRWLWRCAASSPSRSCCTPIAAASTPRHSSRGSPASTTWCARWRTAVCWDNAQQESFWATLKVEFYDRYLWPTKTAAKLAVGDWIERVYNRRRRHSALAMMRPVEFEDQLTQTAQAA
ncbi:reverse transcriptase family protein [Mycobacterium xenopi 4042]|uniref:Reverse transcriptase family protein n=1 Tax=Mycobacterium xenopi 4042 TaxID=1299334 RepID=X8E5N5_MYCXE|nr:reverse transcriptase family protein [Mycobacterium xenopi 4042]